MKRGEAHGEEAQALIEFAFFAVILLYFFLGTVDFGRFLYYDNAIRSAARVGAEVASNHCPYAGYACGTTQNGLYVTDDYVMWSTYCEASSYVNLNLGQYGVGQPNTQSTGTQAFTVPNGSAAIGPCQPDNSSKSWTPTCATGASCGNCVNDICVAPESRHSGTFVAVSVGYDFQPIAPLLSNFFQVQSCWHVTDQQPASLDDAASNGHTLCAQSVGKVY